MLTAWEHFKSPGPVFGVRRAPFDSVTISEVMKASVHLGLLDLFERLAHRHEGLLSADFWSWALVWSKEKGCNDAGTAERFAAIEKGYVWSALMLRQC